MIDLFDDTEGRKDAQFHAWRDQHPNGFVLCTHADRLPGNLILHCANCRHMKSPARAVNKNSMTSGYNKVCSENINEIWRWARKNINSCPSSLRTCKTCKPDSPEVNILTENYEQIKQKFETDIANIKNESIEICLQRLKTAPKYPDKVDVSTTVYMRNIDVVKVVLHMAQGKCAACRKDGPFRRPDGEIFLEVHHIVPLSKGGQDTVANTEALCPNCHREKHFGMKRHAAR